MGIAIAAIQNSVSKASIEAQQKEWAELSYTLTYLASVAMAGAKEASSAALEVSRSLVVPDDVHNDIVDVENDSVGHYL